MMLEKLKKWAKKESIHKDIFDIVLFGSYAKGKARPNDLDIAVIFKTLPLKERLLVVQELKRKLTLAIKNTVKGDIKIDMKGILWQELFEYSFFGRTGIIWEGISLLTGKLFAEKIGFLSSALFIYDLQDKSHTEKVKINYILKGRNKGLGMVQKLQGKHLAPGVVEIPAGYALEFEEVLKKQKIRFVRRNILVQG